MPFSLSFRPASLGSSPSLFVPLSQDKGLETRPFPLELSWLFHSRWLSSFPSQPTSCSGNSSYTRSATGNDPNCFVSLGQSNHALVWDAFMYQIPAWPDFPEVLGKSGQSQWVPRGSASLGVRETVTPQLRGQIRPQTLIQFPGESAEIFRWRSQLVPVMSNK